MLHDPTAVALLEVALAIATGLYFALIRRRAAQTRNLDSRLGAIVDNYGRSGLPRSGLG
jgi:hypothetical protein